MVPWSPDVEAELDRVMGGQRAVCTDCGATSDRTVYLGRPGEAVCMGCVAVLAARMGD
jgi:hypothetical protein